MTSLVTPHSCPIDERSSFSRWSMRLRQKQHQEIRRNFRRCCFCLTVNQRSWKHRVALMTIRKNFLKQLLMFWKIQAYFKELMFEYRLKQEAADDNKKEFFETASHVLKNSGLFQGADVWIPFKARGCERSVQLRANKRWFFKIAPNILEKHR